MAEFCVGLKAWLEKFELGQFFEAADEACKENDATKAVDILELDKEDFEDKLGLKKVSKKKFDKAMAELKKMCEEGGEAAPGGATEGEKPDIGQEVDRTIAELGSESLSKKDMPEEFCPPADNQKINKLSYMLGNPAWVLEGCPGELTGSDYPAFKLLQFSLNMIASFAKLACEVWGKEGLEKIGGSTTAEGYALIYNGTHMTIKGEEKDLYEKLGPEMIKLQKEVEPYHSSLDEIQEPIVQVLELYKEAAEVKKRLFEPLMLLISQKLDTEKNPVVLKVAALKGMLRVLEKAVLRPSSGVPWDIVRALVVCSNMDQIRVAVGLIIKQPSVKCVELNDRFNKPKNGWADVSLYIQFNETGCDRTVCEIQLTHQKMMTVRVQLKAHDSYDNARFAAELARTLGSQTTVSLPWSQFAVPKEKGAVRVAGARTVTENELESSQNVMNTADVIYIITPNGQQKSAGDYEMLADEKANGHPIWKMRNGDRYLFTSPDGKWRIGDHEEKEGKWTSNKSYIASKEAHGGTLPHNIGNKWERYDKSMVADSEIVVTRKMPKAPPLLFIVSPTGQFMCAGEYELVEDNRPNGQPMWKQKGGERYLYDGTDGKWTIGGKKEFEKNFDCASGWIDSPKNHGGLMPDKVPGNWKYYDGSKWHEDPNISCSIKTVKYPLSLIVTCPKGQQLCAGKYELVKGERPNGHPLWKQKGDDRWMYSDINGKWTVGGMAAKEKNFECDLGRIDSPQGHGGVMPNQIKGKWKYWDGKAWQEDEGFAVTAASPVLYVVSPKGQQACAGTYEIVHGEFANDMNYWKQKGGERWMYSGTDGKWTIGGTAAKEKNFKCDIGRIDSPRPHEGLFPDELTGSWKYWDSSKWVDDSQILVTWAPPVLFANVPMTVGQTQCTGEYLMVPGESPNGFPLWKQNGDERWLYSNQDGKWMIGGLPAKEKNFACNLGRIDSAVSHGGVMPDLLACTWKWWDGKEWHGEESINMSRGPALLNIISPNGQQKCAGEYQLVAGETPNGMPLWKRNGSDRWLYNGTDGKWTLGGPTEKEKDFDCSSGFMCSPKEHGGRMPNLLETAWQYYDGSAWQTDPKVSVSTGLSGVPPVLRLATPQGQQKCEGDYVLAEGNERIANGHVMWKHRTEEKWLYSGTDGKWTVGGEREKEKNFVCASGWIDSPAIHGGVLPHKLQGVWKFWDGKEWQESPDIKLYAAITLPQVLFVKSPNGQQKCAGRYAIIPDFTANGQPVWSHGGGDRHIYCTTDGKWAIGDHEEKDKKFNSTVGYITTVAPHRGKLPHETDLAWKRWDGKDWQEKKDISISEGPMLLYINTPNGQQQTAGEYELCLGENPNRAPLWRMRRGARWMYTATDGKWTIGDNTVKEKSFNCAIGRIDSPAVSKGANPETLGGKWLYYNGTKFEPDDRIKISWGPLKLWVSSPHKQSDCAGMYELVFGLNPNGMPVWMKTSGDRYLYSGTDGKWTIADQAVKEKDFNCAIGRIDSPKTHGGLMPDQLEGKWKSWDGKDWAEDGDIVITRGPRKLKVTIPRGQSGAAGEYEIVLREYPNGHPLWKRKGGDVMYLYSGTDGKWTVADGNVKDKDFDCAIGRVDSPCSHGGRGPHEVPGKWKYYDGTKWHDDDGILVQEI